jgi:uncharacterized protein YjdB
LLVGRTLTLEATVKPENAARKTVKWSTNDDQVATVNPAGEVTAIAPGTAKITVATDDGNFTATCTVTVEEENVLIPVTGVTLAPPDALLIVGNTLTLEATVEPDEATNKTVTWSSDDDKIATVNSAGEVTAVAPGTAMITVTTNDGEFTATCSVTVEDENVLVPVTGVTSNFPASLLVGRTLTLEVTVEPADATNKTVTWSTDNEQIATVNQAGEITALAPGQVIITATTNEGGYKAIGYVTVISEGLNRSAALLLVGRTQTLKANIELDDAFNKTLVWATSNDLIATVNSAGEVTAIAPGEAIITATTNDGEYMATCTVTVVTTGITMATNDITIYTGFSISAGTGNIIIDWGDGTIRETYNVSSSELVFSHVYLLMSEYHITITGNNIVSFSHKGYFPYTNDFNNSSLKYNPRPDYNRLSALDVSSNPALKKLSCIQNLITSLDVSRNTELTHLTCFYNRVTSLDVSRNTKLTYLNLAFNQLTDLDVSRNTELTVLGCSNNFLTSLNVSSNPALIDLSCGNNSLTTLDVSSNAALTELYCSWNKLTTLNVSRNHALIYLQCIDNELTALDLSSNNTLKELWCSRNQLTTSALNNMFGTLHNNTTDENCISISYNPGTSDCDVRIAEEKGWRVY